MERQLAPFINGEFAQPTEEMKTKAASAPTHNMGSKQALGCLDRMWRQAPNATMGFLNGKLKGKLNNTLSWLEAKSSTERDNLLRFLVTEANEDRAKRLVANKDLLNNLQERRKNVEFQRAKSKKNGIVKDIKLFFKTKNAEKLSFDKVLVK